MELKLVTVAFDPETWQFFAPSGAAEDSLGFQPVAPRTEVRGYLRSSLRDAELVVAGLG